MRIYGLLLLLVFTAGNAPLAVAQTGTSDSPGLTYTQRLSVSAIRDVQQGLHGLSFYKGSVDGNWGPDSEAALKQFQQTHGLQVTGQLNEATAKTLNLKLTKLLNVQQQSNASESGAGGSANGSANQAQTSNAANEGNLSESAIRKVQRRLRQLNYNVGSADGIWGADTQKALMQFQKGHALQATGQLNPATIGALGLNPDKVLMSNKQQ